MKRLAILLVLALASVARADYLGIWNIGDYITINVTTHQFSTGAAYDATGNVLLDIYEDATNTEIVNDTVMAKFDSRTGLYQARVQLTAASGFEKGKHYTCIVAATVDGVSALCYHNFQVEEIVDDVWDELLTGGAHNNKNSAGRLLRTGSSGGGGGGGTQVTIHSGTAQAGTTNTITLQTTANATDDIYNGNMVVLTGGTGLGQTRVIVDYDGTSKIATVDKNWTTNPTATTTYDVIAAAGSIYSDEGMATAADATHITIAGTASATNDIYNGSFLVIISGTGNGQVRTITDYDGGTKIVTVATWDTIPDTTSVYAIIPTSTTVSDTPEPVPGLSIEDVQAAMTAQGFTNTLATNLGATNTLAAGATGFAAIKADSAAILTDTGELQADWTNGGRLDLILDSITADLANGTYGLDALYRLLAALR